jgi:hypothetical protein
MVRPMTHFPGHERRAFLDWIEAGFPDTATVEDDYEPREVPTPDLLRRFLLPLSCTDTLPKTYAEAVADQIGYGGDVAGISYAVAASALLVREAAGDVPAEKYLALLLDSSDL